MEFRVANIVMQPTTLCNLNCSYCYLGSRNKNLRMLPKVAEEVAASLADIDRSLSIIWHGGEPLTVGPDYFRLLLEPFEVLRQSGHITHALQTNATLINRQWCDLFLKYDVRVGISLDGPEWANSRRTDWNGNSSFERILRGAKCLDQSNIQFTAIAVVADQYIPLVQNLYEFFASLPGCQALGINFEEKIGTNRAEISTSKDKIVKFWKELFSTWEKNPTLEIREFRRVLRWMYEINTIEPETSGFPWYDLFPSIAYNGDVVFLSPEFLQATSIQSENFIIGNVLQQSLSDMISKYERVSYIKDFERGIQLCESNCKYFDFCRGGQAANKYFELGTLNGTETTYCRNTQQAVVDAIVQSL